MKRFDDISDINADTDTGKIFFASIAVLSGTDFINEDKIFGSECSKKEALDELVRIANHVYFETINISKKLDGNIDMSLDEGRMLMTTLDILTSDECKNGKYGGHKYVNDILVDVFEKTHITERNRKIDLII